VAGGLVLVHGFPLDARMWDALRAELKDAHAVHAPDLDGRGARRDRPPSTSVDAMATQVRDMLDAEGLDQVDLGGFSMGGYVCLAFWRLYPERVRSLLLVDTRAGADSDEGRKGRDDLAQRVSSTGPAAAADAMVPKLLSGAAPDEMAERVRGWVMDEPVGTIVADLQALRDRPDSRPDLAGIDRPVLVLVGAEDVLTPPAESEAMAAALPRATLRVIEGAGHLSPVERPSEVAAAVKEFLASV